MNNLKQKIRNEIVRWNNNFPLDYWWRKKYKIPFGSPEHRRMTFVDMYRDFLEDKMMAELDEPKDSEDFQVKEITKVPQKELDDDFDNLDISKY